MLSGIGVSSQSLAYTSTSLMVQENDKGAVKQASAQKASVSSDIVQLSVGATDFLKNTTSASGELNPRQKRMNEVNDAMDEALGLKNFLSPKEMKEERKLLDQMSDLMGIPMYQMTNEEVQKADDLYRQIDEVYAKGVVTRADQMRVNAMYDQIDELQGGVSQEVYNRAYDKLTPDQRKEKEQIEVKLMNLRGLNIDENNVEASFAELDRMLAPLDDERNLLLASSISDYESFSINISVESFRFGESDDKILKTLSDLLDIGTQGLSDFNRRKADALLSLATRGLEKNTNGSTQLQDGLNKLLEDGKLKEQNVNDTQQRLRGLQTNASFSLSKYTLNLNSGSLFTLAR